MMLKSGAHMLVSGLLPRDAEFKYVGEKDTPLCKFGVKADETGQGDDKQVKWINCTCWRDVAYAAQYLNKGDVVLCAGKLTVREYTDKNGEPAKSEELVCDGVFLMQKSRGEYRGGEYTPPKKDDKPNMYDTMDITDGDLDDLPFNSGLCFPV